MGVILIVDNVSKQYRLGDVGTGSLKDDFKRWRYKATGRRDPFLKIGEENIRTLKSSNDYVWALKNISFEVKQGDILGIIGKNGAGKSTLLKILSRTTSPTMGSVKVKGRITSLLEVGTGFHGELSGRENIFLNGAIMGMKKHEIKSKFDEIVTFAGVERYIDTPVKRYSSGMYVRLAFAVAAHLEPDIMIIDEVLAVGDAEFQKKALGKMKEVSNNEGRTVLFVSHNFNAVRSLCNSSIVLENGKLIMITDVATALNYYENENSSVKSWTGKDGDEVVTILKTQVYSQSGLDNLANDELIYISILIELKENFGDLVIAATIKSGNGHPLATILYNDFNDYSKLEKGTYQVIFAIPPFTLADGDYKLDFNVSIPYIKKINTDAIGLSFKIIANSNFGNKYHTDKDKTLNSVIRPNWFKSIERIN